MTIEEYYEKYKPLFDSPDRDIPTPPVKGAEESWSNLIIERREQDIFHLFMDLVSETPIYHYVEGSPPADSISKQELDELLNTIKRLNIKWNDIGALFLTRDGKSPIELNYFAKAFASLIMEDELKEKL